jgi:hypothetical protein
MLGESNPMLHARRFEREWEVRKDIGDYTLFLTGMFPEYVATLPRRGLRLDRSIDYVKAGKESYRIVAAFDQFEYPQVAPLFRRLAEEFESCVYGLNRVKSDLEVLREEQYQVGRTTCSRGGSRCLGAGLRVGNGSRPSGVPRLMHIRSRSVFRQVDVRGTSWEESWTNRPSTIYAKSTIVYPPDYPEVTGNCELKPEQPW